MAAYGGLHYHFFKIRYVGFYYNRSNPIAMSYEPGQAKTCIRAYASAQSDLGLRCPLNESLVTTECLNREERPG